MDLAEEAEEGGNREYTNDKCDFACRINVGSRSIPWTEAALKWSARGAVKQISIPFTHTQRDRKKGDERIEGKQIIKLTDIDRDPALVTAHVQHSLPIKQPRPHLHQVRQSWVEDMCAEIMSGWSVSCCGALISCRGGKSAGVFEGHRARRALEAGE